MIFKLVTSEHLENGSDVSTGVAELFLQKVRLYHLPFEKWIHLSPEVP